MAPVEFDQAGIAEADADELRRILDADRNRCGIGDRTEKLG